MNREYGSEFGIIQLSDGYFENLGKGRLDKVYVRSGREAIGLVIQHNEGKKATVLLPAYLCPSMLNPFINRGWTYDYYHIDKQLEIDASDLIEKVSNDKPTLVFLMSYFGYSNQGALSKRIKEISPETKVLFDFTHCLLSFEEIWDDSIDYYVASIRKWFGIASGAVFLSKEINRRFIQNDSTPYYRLMSQALSLKNEFLTEAKDSTKNELKQYRSEADKELCYDSIYYAHPDDIQRIESINARSIIAVRKTNFFHLYSILQENPNINFFKNNFTDYSGFMLPICVMNRRILQERLSNKGIFCQVIWGIPEDSKEYEDSLFIFNHILCIPIDQRYNYWDIEDIASIINYETKSL